MSNANEPDKVNAGALAVVLILVAFTTLAVALVVTSLVRQETAEVTAERDLSQDRAYRTLKASQLDKLRSESPSWSDRAKGLILLPIDRAMALTLEAVRENPYALSPGIKPEAMGGAGPEDEKAEANENAPAKNDATVASEDAKDADKKDEKSAPKKPAPIAPAPVAPAPVAPAPAPAPAP